MALCCHSLVFGSPCNLPQPGMGIHPGVAAHDVSLYEASTLSITRGQWQPASCQHQSAPLEMGARRVVPRSWCTRSRSEGHPLTQSWILPGRSWSCGQERSRCTRQMAPHLRRALFKASATLATGQLSSSSTVSAPEDFRAAPKNLLSVPELQELSACDDADLLHLFLLNFCAQGVGMTEKVEMWIRRAGQECLAMADVPGNDVKMLSELGESLLEAALEEAGHDKWFRNDVSKLVEAWNEKHPEHSLHEDQLMTSGYFQSVLDYGTIHDKHIDSKQPYAQIAMRSAIEQLSLVLGAPLVAIVRALLGDSYMPKLTFLYRHVALDVKHVEESAGQRDEFLAANPQMEPVFAEATYGILEIYGRFLADCWKRAKKMREEQKQ